MEYTDQHKAFLQIFLQQGILLNRDASAIAVQVFNNNTAVSQHALIINVQLNVLCMSLRSIKCEHTGEEYWVLANNLLDDLTKFHPEFQQGQLELLRKIYSEIITSSDKNISGTDCLNLCSTLENKLTKYAAQDLLDEMVSGRWFYYSKGFYYMGVRSIGQMNHYFKATYEDSLTNCVLCKQIVFYGHTCQKCNMVLHNYCLLNYAKIRKPLKCPQCSKPMPDVSIDDSQDCEKRNFLIDDGSDDSEEKIPPVKKRRTRHH